MNLRKFDDVTVATIGFGTAFLGVPPDRAKWVYNGKPYYMDIPQGIKTLTTAISSGIKLLKEAGVLGQVKIMLDTSLLYGDFRALEIIGWVLRAHPEWREHVLISTKVGQTYLGGIDYSAKALLGGLWLNEVQMGTKPDLVYLHDPMGMTLAQVLLAKRILEDVGVKRVGLAATDPGITADLLETGEFKWAMVPDALSLICLTIERRIITLAQKYGISVVVATPLERGLLTNNPPDDFLNRHFTSDCLAQVRLIRELCQSYDVPLSAAALQWPTYRYAEVASAVVGLSLPQHAEEAIQAMGIEIPKALWDELIPLIRHFDGQREMP